VDVARQVYCRRQRGWVGCRKRDRLTHPGERTPPRAPHTAFRRMINSRRSVITHASPLRNSALVSTMTQQCLRRISHARILKERHATLHLSKFDTNALFVLDGLANETALKKLFEALVCDEEVRRERDNHCGERREARVGDRGTGDDWVNGHRLGGRFPRQRELSKLTLRASGMAMWRIARSRGRT
jgi:hypothetical protein